jgi:hypothetical protein
MKRKTATIQLDQLSLGLLCGLLKQRADKIKPRRGETQHEADIYKAAVHELRQIIEKAYDAAAPPDRRRAEA